MPTWIHILIAAPPLIISVILHEIAHGYTAEQLGDPTARTLGRITLNPLKHIDPFLTLLLPGMLLLAGSPVVFGGAKPVPVNPMYFKNPRRDMAYVALAGPVTNFFLAGICFVVFLLLSRSASPGLPAVLCALWMIQGVLINLVLGIFNLVPIPPLDGGRIVVGFLPLPLARRWARLERFGILIVFLLLYSGLLDWMFEPVIRLTAEHLLKL